MKTFFNVARNAKGGIVGYGSGPTPALAEIRCRGYIIQERKEGRVTAYEPYTMPKPLFRVGQRVLRKATGKVVKVLAVADSPWLAGSVIVKRNVEKSSPLFGFRVWENEDRFSADVSLKARVEA